MTSLPPLPPRFLDRMRHLLGDDFPDFEASYREPTHAGLRVNLVKTTAERLASLLPWPMTPVPWCSSGFLLPPGSQAGKHPLHASGLYYLQEPSAMAVGEALDIQPGQWVIDVSAAPGGKSTHIASLLQGEGLLIANDPVPGRIKALGENLERWGTPNTVITNAAVPQLAGALTARFDRVLVDAPCSGEGMFRRSAAAITAWSEEHVRGSAIRQALLLDHASRLVRPGGLLLYSTCTFAPEENERQIDQFLRSHQEWELAEMPRLPGMDPGRGDWVEDPIAELSRTRRIWPHRSPGDGHFLALLRAPGDAPGEQEALPKRMDSFDAPQHVVQMWKAFRQETLPEFPEGGRLVVTGDHLFLQRWEPKALREIRIVRPGMPLGHIRGRRFVPAHGLALAAETGTATNSHELTGQDVETYLRGETIAADGPSGWVLMRYEGFAIGWGKRSAGVIKNHYPRGLRW